MTPLQDVVEDMELDCLTPLMRGAWLNALQYREQEVIFQVAGMPVNVNVQNLGDIDVDLQWRASSQAANSQLRAQQAISLIQAIMPLVPVMQQQGYVINFTVLIEKIYSDGFGFRGFKDFISQNPMQMMGQMGQMGALQGAMDPSNPGPEQADRIRSAVEQAGGGSGEMQPGEGEEFQDVRAQADDMAGQMGGGNY